MGYTSTTSTLGRLALHLELHSDLLVKREVENKTETHKTDGWENQR